VWKYITGRAGGFLGFGPGKVTVRDL